MTALGRVNIRRLIELARRGNHEAIRWLKDIAAHETEAGACLPSELSEWTATPMKNRRGRPCLASGSTGIADLFARERAVDSATWAAWWNIRAGQRTSLADGSAGPAFIDAADWLSEAHHVHVGASAVRTWFYRRRHELDRKHAEVEAIAAALN